MKKAILLLSVILPFFCFAQTDSISTENLSSILSNRTPGVIKMDSGTFHINCGCKDRDKVLIIVDGKLSTYKELINIKVENIKHFKVLKDTASIALYSKLVGEKAKHGVIVALTKEYYSKTEKIENAVHYIQNPNAKKYETILSGRVSDVIKIKPSNDKESRINCRDIKKKPLFLIDGIEGGINNLKAEDIADFTVLEDKKDIEKYGIAGENGVVLITTKKSEEYEVIVFDAGYESFLATQKPKEYYSETYLKGKNALMVNEWNYRYRLPRQYNSNIYEVSIDYDTKTDYGLDMEYKIYMFFRFMEKEHNMSLIGDRLTAKI